ncbi:hypothetical protein GNI_152430 [Gregarina niphandrodes]|uniref:Uncharacterized protein n=1 Tax=Gregarina niphandrodes TaxID=110365 RepID=A0A023AZD0_GRENI|nr:hypothetical protein GNI_152430 [Gregarina niphandrodes]EZG44096.1 hypothetical protein GNI_152430 [Gregarina niphandrodes]|eukprot:XP_011132807.1 hypothetical protein GNI_152430 [Gregarina niphandrodes]
MGNSNEPAAGKGWTLAQLFEESEVWRDVCATIVGSHEPSSPGGASPGGASPGGASPGDGWLLASSPLASSPLASTQRRRFKLHQVQAEEWSYLWRSVQWPLIHNEAELDIYRSVILGQFVEAVTGTSTPTPAGADAVRGTEAVRVVGAILASAFNAPRDVVQVLCEAQLLAQLLPRFYARHGTAERVHASLNPSFGIDKAAMQYVVVGKPNEVLHVQLLLPTYQLRVPDTWADELTLNDVLTETKPPEDNRLPPTLNADGDDLIGSHTRHTDPHLTNSQKAYPMSRATLEPPGDLLTAEGLAVQALATKDCSVDQLLYKYLVARDGAVADLDLADTVVQVAVGCTAGVEEAVEEAAEEAAEETSAGNKRRVVEHVHAAIVSEVSIGYMLTTTATRLPKHLTSPQRRTKAAGDLKRAVHTVLEFYNKNTVLPGKAAVLPGANPSGAGQLRSGQLGTGQLGMNLPDTFYWLEAGTFVTLEAAGEVLAANVDNTHVMKPAMSLVVYPVAHAALRVHELRILRHVIHYIKSLTMQLYESAQVIQAVSERLKGERAVVCALKSLIELYVLITKETRVRFRAAELLQSFVLLEQFCRDLTTTYPYPVDLASKDRTFHDVLRDGFVLTIRAYQSDLRPPKLIMLAKHHPLLSLTHLFTHRSFPKGILCLLLYLTTYHPQHPNSDSRVRTRNWEGSPKGESPKGESPKGESPKGESTKGVSTKGESTKGETDNSGPELGEIAVDDDKGINIEIGVLDQCLTHLISKLEILQNTRQLRDSELGNASSERLSTGSTLVFLLDSIIQLLNIRNSNETAPSLFSRSGSVPWASHERSLGESLVVIVLKWFQLSYHRGALHIAVRISALVVLVRPHLLHQQISNEVLDMVTAWFKISHGRIQRCLSTQPDSIQHAVMTANKLIDHQSMEGEGIVDGKGTEAQGTEESGGVQEEGGMVEGDQRADLIFSESVGAQATMPLSDSALAQSATKKLERRAMSAGTDERLPILLLAGECLGEFLLCFLHPKVVTKNQYLLRKPLNDIIPNSIDCHLPGGQQYLAIQNTLQKNLTLLERFDSQLVVTNEKKRASFDKRRELDTWLDLWNQKAVFQQVRPNTAP